MLEGSGMGVPGVGGGGEVVGVAHFITAQEQTQLN